MTVVVLSVGHLVATVAVFLAHAGDTMSRFDTGAPASLGSTLLEGLSATLLFPIVTIAYHVHWMAAGYAGWAPVALNSLLWGTALLWGCRMIRKRAMP